jgi:hypothetical protein
LPLLLCSCAGTTAAAGPPSTWPELAPATARAQEPDPVRVQVLRVGIDAPLDPLHLGSAGQLVAPAYGRAGWYRNGPEPGEFGRAVIAGHVDSLTGPDTFYRLRRVHKGDLIVISLVDGRTLDFQVRQTGVYPQDRFPTDRVYGGPRRTAELRLITCGGAYERNHGGYQANVVVFATLVSTTAHLASARPSG